MRRGAIYKYHKKIIKIMRELNRQMREDDQFKGRFYAHEVKHQYQMFGDLSGYSYRYVFEFVDKVTGKTQDVYIRGCCGKWYPNTDEKDHHEVHKHNLMGLYFFKHHLFEAFNNFIVDYIGT